MVGVLLYMDIKRDYGVPGGFIWLTMTRQASACMMR